MPYWRHFTTDPIGTAAAALQTAKTHSWTQLDSEERVKQFRALLIMSLQAATLSDASGPLGVLSGGNYGGDKERNAAGAALARTAIIIAPVGDIVLDKNVNTYDGAPPVDLPDDPGPIDVGALPALAVIALVTVAAAAACYVATVVTQSDHAIAFEAEKTKRILQAQASSIEVIAKHVEREKLTGHTLPFEPEERTVLQGLETTQREVIKDKHQSLPTPFDGAREFGQAIADTTKKLGDSTAQAISWALPAGLLVGGYLLFKK
jgi:hypothetical protein